LGIRMDPKPLEGGLSDEEAKKLQSKYAILEERYRKYRKFHNAAGIASVVWIFELLTMGFAGIFSRPITSSLTNPLDASLIAIFVCDMLALALLSRRARTYRVSGEDRVFIATWNVYSFIDGVKDFTDAQSIK